MVQAIDRLRLIHNEKRKTVYILCNIPLDLPIDELVTWKQLTGDRRWSDALAECDARGWDALPLAAKEMCRLFPDLWARRKEREGILHGQQIAVAQHDLERAAILVLVRCRRAEDNPSRSQPAEVSRDLLAAYGVSAAKRSGPLNGKETTTNEIPTGRDLSARRLAMRLVQTTCYFCPCNEISASGTEKFRNRSRTSLPSSALDPRKCAAP